jgi:hypothetical protein
LHRIDSHHVATHRKAVLKLLRHLLCLGLLFGLAGNGVAVAAPCIFMDQGQSAEMVDMPDCQMASACPDCGDKSDSNQKSGHDKTTGCMAMAACTALPAMKEPVAQTPNRLQTGIIHIVPAAAELAGRDVAPEPEPPTLLS